MMRRKFIKTLASAINLSRAGKGCMVGIGLFSIGIAMAFARFLPHDMVSAGADSAIVQVVSAVCLVLSGFTFAVVFGATKDHASGNLSGRRNVIKGVNNPMFDLWHQSPRAERSGAAVVEPKKAYGQSGGVAGRFVEVDSADKNNAVELDSNCPVANSTVMINVEPFDLRKDIVGKKLTDDTRAFLEDRLEGLVIDSPMKEERVLEWGQNVVSLIDEIKLLRTRASADDLTAVDKVADCLREKMKDMNLALIDEEEWNPSCQRAVAVMRSETASKTKILNKKSCGMTFNGKVIKKQEVEVEMPFSQQEIN